MDSHGYVETLAHRLLQLGILLFLIGLLTGFVAPTLTNPRMGLSSHLEGVLNGLFLVLLGLVWKQLSLSRITLVTTFWLAVYGTFANWAGTLLGAFWGASAFMPIAAAGHHASVAKEAVISALLVTLSLAMVTVCVLVLWGLRAGATRLDGAA